MLTNILINPSLEGDYTERGAPELKVAPGWEIAFRHGQTAPDGPNDADHVCGRPEYKPMLASSHPTRVLHGQKSQCAFIRWKVMDACILQRVPVPVGRLLTFRANVHAWCSNSDDPGVCDGELYFRLGLDLLGGISPFYTYPGVQPSPLIWTDWQPALSIWQELELQAEATDPYATVFVRFWNKYRYAHNDAYIDDLALLVEQGPEDGDQQPGPIPEPGAYVTRQELATIFRTMAAQLS